MAQPHELISRKRRGCVGLLWRQLDSHSSALPLLRASFQQLPLLSLPPRPASWALKTFCPPCPPRLQLSVMIRSSKNDMINPKLSAVARNQIWREHLDKERAHGTLREEFTISPLHAASGCVTDKPHQAYSQHLTQAEYADLSARSMATFQQRMQNNNGVLLTGRSALAQPQPAQNTSRRAGGEIMSPSSTRKAEVVQAFAAEVAVRRAAAPVSPSARPDLSAALLHDLHGSQLSPRQKFAYPQTANQDYGWISEPLLRTDQRAVERAEYLASVAAMPNSQAAAAAFTSSSMHSARAEGYVGRARPSAETVYADAYVVQHGASPFHISKDVPPPSATRTRGQGGMTTRRTQAMEAPVWHSGRRR